MSSSITLRWMQLDMIKRHLRIDDYLQDDELTLYAASAEQEALDFMERTEESLYEEYGCIPAPIILACLVHIGTAVKYREEETDRTLNRLPYSWEAKLIKYRPAARI